MTRNVSQPISMSLATCGVLIFTTSTALGVAWTTQTVADLSPFVTLGPSLAIRADGTLALQHGNALAGRPVKVTGGTLQVETSETPLPNTTVELAGGEFLVTDTYTPIVPVEPPAGAVGIWSFEEAAGDLAADSAGDNDGTITDAIWVDDPLRGSVLDFEGATSVDIPPAAFSTVDTGITIALWQYGDPAFQPQQSDYIFEGSIGGVRGVGSHLPWGDSNVYWDAGGAGGCCGDRSSKGAAAADVAGQWNHWAFTKDTATGQQKIYLNGVEWHSAEGRVLSLAGIDMFKIGSDMNGGTNYDGMVDDFYLYDRALTAEEVQVLVSMQPGVVPTDVSTTGLLVTGDSTVNAQSAAGVSLGALTLESGVLTTVGQPVSFASTTIDAEATEVGFDPQTDTDYGVIDANNAPVTISKAGPSTWNLETAPINLNPESSRWQVLDGTLQIAEEGPLGG